MNTERLGPLLEGGSRQEQVMGLKQHIQSFTTLPLERCEFLTVLIIRAVHGNADAMQHFSALAACFRPRRSTTSIPSGTASAGGGAKSTSDYRTGCNGAASGLAACVWFAFALWPWSCMAMNRLRRHVQASRTGCNGAASGLAASGIVALGTGVWFTFALWPWSCMAMNRLRESACL